MVPKQLLLDVVGMSYERAEEIIREVGYTPRKTVIDGKPLLVTQDLRMDRINLVIANGRVVSVHVG